MWFHALQMTFLKLVYSCTYRISHRLPTLNATFKWWRFRSYFVRCLYSCHCSYQSRVMFFSFFFFVCFVVVLLFCFVFLPVIFLQSFLSLHGRNGISVHVVASFISLLRTLKFLFPCYVRLYHKMGSRKKYETRTSIRMKLSFCFKRQYSLFI